MDSLPILLLIFVVGLATLVKASDFFTDAAEKTGSGHGTAPLYCGGNHCVHGGHRYLNCCPPCLVFFKAHLKW